MNHPLLQSLLPQPLVAHLVVFIICNKGHIVKSSVSPKEAVKKWKRAVNATQGPTIEISSRQRVMTSGEMI